MGERPNPSDRRDFLKKSVLAGGLVWAAPAISTVASAGAQAAGTPAPGACCTASAFGLRLSLLGGSPTTFGVNGCVVVAEATLLNTVTVNAQAVCGSATSPAGGPCVAQASLANLVVGGTLITTALGGPITATALSSTATADCKTCSTSGSSTILGLSVGSFGPILVTACNLNVLGLVFVNEQVCDGNGTLTVNALRVTIPGVIDLIVAQSKAGAPGCACVTC